MRNILIAIIMVNLISADLLKPEDNASLNQIHIMFEWEQVAGTHSYHFELSDNDAFINPIISKNIDNIKLINIVKNLIEWNHTYYWRVTPIDENGQYESPLNTFMFTTNSTISNPSVVLHFPDNYNDGVTILGSFFDYFTAIIDKEGNEIWNSGDLDLIFYNTDEYGRFFGSIYDGSLENNYPGVKFSFEEGIIWQEPNDNFIHHDIFQLPNGNYIGLGTSEQDGPIPLGPWTGLFQMLGYEADGETIEFTWVGDKIIEWDADTKEEIWTWNTFDHYNMIDYDSLGGTWFEAWQTDRYDWTHGNAIWFDEEENDIYFSSRHLSRISKIDYPSGNIIWNIGHEFKSDDIDGGEDIGFSFQHSVTKLDNGNLLTFDNGNLSVPFLDQDEPTSRAIEIKVTDNDTLEAELDWEYILPPELYGYLSGNTQKLENGNYLITTIGDGGTSLEISEDGENQWLANYNLQLPDGLVYRAMRIPGMFPVAYSVVFPQFEISTSEIFFNEEDVALEIVISNVGDYEQLFNYELIVEPTSTGYDIQYLIIPEHHSEKIKEYTFSIEVLNSDFTIENQIGSFYLDKDSDITLSFTGSDTLTNYEYNILNSFKLHSPFPNPFNPNVYFEIELNHSEDINISIYDMKGTKLNEIYSGYLNQGKYKFVWNAHTYVSGVYMIKAETKNIIETKKISLIK